MISILSTLDTCKQFLNIQTRVHQLPWRNFKEIPDTARGVYIIEDDWQQPVYVGKGWIRNRQSTHWPKATGTPRSYESYPKGWKYLKENNPELDPKEWTIYYTTLESETELSALEGALIHLLKPLANDETYRDQLSTVISE